MKRLALLSLLFACAAHAAIKKVDDAVPAPKDAPGAESKPSTPKAEEEEDGFEEFRQPAPRGKQSPMNEKDAEKFLRDLLERQGVPKDQLKDKSFLDLLKLMQDKNPGALPRSGSGSLGLFGRLDPAAEKRLNENLKGWIDGHKPGTVNAAPATFFLRDAAKKPAPAKGKKPMIDDLVDSYRKELAAPLILGSAVRADGWLLTKASEAKSAKELQCKVKGVWVAATVVRTWEDDDLALVKVAATDLPVIHWSKNSLPELGSFLTAVAPEGLEPVAIGVVSVKQRNQKMKGRGYLGVELDSDEKGLRIKRVSQDTAAFLAGVLANDRILEIEGRKPNKYAEFTEIVGARKPGDKVKLKLQRGEEVVEKEIKLGDRPAMARPFDNANTFGSELSKRRDEFPQVVQTDFPINANRCGGPVTDLDGNVLGLVIARSGRVETLFLPSELIRQRLAEVDFAKEAVEAAKLESAPKAQPKAEPTSKNEPAPKTDSTPKTEPAKAEPAAK